MNVVDVDVVRIEFEGLAQSAGRVVQFAVQTQGKGELEVELDIFRVEFEGRGPANRRRADLVPLDFAGVTAPTRSLPLETAVNTPDLLIWPARARTSVASAPGGYDADGGLVRLTDPTSSATPMSTRITGHSRSASNAGT